MNDKIPIHLPEPRKFLKPDESLCGVNISRNGVQCQDVLPCVDNATCNKCLKIKEIEDKERKDREEKEAAEKQTKDRIADSASELLAMVEELLMARTGDGILDPASDLFRRGMELVKKIKCS